MTLNVFGGIEFKKMLRFILFLNVFAYRPHVKKHSRLAQKLYIIYLFGKVSKMMFPAVHKFCFNSLTFLIISLTSSVRLLKTL